MVLGMSPVSQAAEILAVKLFQVADGFATVSYYNTFAFFVQGGKMNDRN